MDDKDYYKTLGVAKSATAEEIKKAYRKLVRKHHPDVSRASDADRKTKEINEAYAVLGDADKRAEYDALASGLHGRAPFGPGATAGAHGFGRQGSQQRAFYPGGNGGAFSEDDFLSDLFAHVGRQRQGQAFAQRGDDIHATITVALQDAYHGAERVVRLQAPDGERQVKVMIPKGVLPGQQVRVHGQGLPGRQGGEAGDLVLDVELRADRRYRIDGRHVIARLPVAPWEAALGAAIDVPTPSGTLSVHVPAGSQGGRKLRLKGRGIPAHPAGDLFLELEVVLPPASTERARALYQRMASEMAFDPRAGLRG